MHDFRHLAMNLFTFFLPNYKLNFFKIYSVLIESIRILKYTCLSLYIDFIGDIYIPFGRKYQEKSNLISEQYCFPVAMMANNY